MGRTFCESCESRLQMQTETGKLQFHCVRCKKTYESTPEDSLIFTETNSVNADDLNNYHTFIKNAKYDNTNPTVLQTCPECKNKKVKMIRIGDKLTRIYVCSCGHVFN